MVCATCDFGDPCACERKRLAVGATADGVVGEARGRGRLEGKVREAANIDRGAAAGRGGTGCGRGWSRRPRRYWRRCGARTLRRGRGRVLDAVEHDATSGARTTPVPSRRRASPASRSDAWDPGGALPVRSATVPAAATARASAHRPRPASRLPACLDNPWRASVPAAAPRARSAMRRAPGTGPAIVRRSNRDSPASRASRSPAWAREGVFRIRSAMLRGRATAGAPARTLTERSWCVSPGSRSRAPARVVASRARSATPRAPRWVRASARTGGRSNA